MPVRVISTSIQLDGEAAFKQQLSGVDSSLRTLKAELGYTEAAFRGQANSLEALTEKQKIQQKTVEQQAEKVRALEKALTDSVKAFGDSDKRTDNYRQSLLKAKKGLIEMQEELADTERYLDEARQSTDQCAESIDKFGREVKDAGGGMESMGGGMGNFMSALGNLKGVLAGGAVVGGVKALADAMFDVVDSTEEYRSIMGSLEVSSQQAGYTAEETAEAYKRLYGVVGDAQTAATATANLQALGLEQEDLITVIDAATGAWSKYNGSIPIDSLAESIRVSLSTINRGIKREGFVRIY